MASLRDILSSIDIARDILLREYDLDDANQFDIQHVMSIDMMASYDFYDWIKRYAHNSDVPQVVEDEDGVVTVMGLRTYPCNQHVRYRLIVR